MNPAKFESLDDWLPWLETLSPREIVLGLERVHEVLDRLAISTPGIVISVAGTNGKGSSVAMLEALLRHNGLSTGCYTSPHVIAYNERIRIDGAAASDASIISALEEVETLRRGLPLTFFEFGTLAALVAFDAAKVDAWILEVGMGGRLDAVNAVEPDGSIITSISLDHCHWLGSDRESIAGEKAGIMRRGKPVVFAAPDMPAAIETAATDIGARLLRAGRDYEFGASLSEPSRWWWRGQDCVLEDLSPPALRGPTQLQNAAGVLTLLEALGHEAFLDAKSVNEALSRIELPGRFQVVDKRHRWILDVAHNPGAAEVLASLLADQPGPVTCVIGMFSDKDVGGFVGPLLAHVERWISVTVSGPRAAAATALARTIANASGKPCRIVERITDALPLAAASTEPGASILVTGSFYMVGPALQWLAR